MQKNKTSLKTTECKTNYKTERLISEVKDYLWGGQKLRDYGIKSDKPILAEAWVLSMHKDGASKLSDGTGLIEAFGCDAWGTACEKFEFFPVLVKFIDAKDNLSVQVHPSDDYALKNEGQYGKTEMWYVVEHDENAGIYLGFKKDITKDEYKNSIKNNTLLELLNFIKVKKGDCFFIPSGTVHAIGKGCTILEVQQNSNLTYRVYDYARVGADGMERELHIDKAIAVSTLKKYSKVVQTDGYLADCKYFTARLLNNETTIQRTDSFTGVICIGGVGKVDGQDFNLGDTFFIPAGVKSEIKGNVEFIEVFVKGQKI